MTKRFTLADYISTLRLGKRNKQIYFSLYDNGTGDTKKSKPLFTWQRFPFDQETNSNALSWFHRNNSRQFC